MYFTILFILDSRSSTQLFQSIFLLQKHSIAHTGGQIWDDNARKASKTPSSTQAERKNIFHLAVAQETVQGVGDECRAAVQFFLLLANLTVPIAREHAEEPLKHLPVSFVFMSPQRKEIRLDGRATRHDPGGESRMILEQDDVSLVIWRLATPVNVAFDGDEKHRMVLGDHVLNLGQPVSDPLQGASLASVKSIIVKRLLAYAGVWNRVAKYLEGDIIDRNSVPDTLLNPLHKGFIFGFLLRWEADHHAEAIERVVLGPNPRGPVLFLDYLARSYREAR